MFDATLLDRAASDLDAFVSRLDVEAVAVADARALVERLAKVSRQVDAATALLGARVAEAAASDREAARWLASTTRSSEGEALDALRTGRSTLAAPGTRTAFQAGELSARTARSIGEAAQASPGSERRLLAMAETGSAEATRKEANRTRQQASREGAAERERRRHARRTLSSWEDDDGGIAGRFATTTRQWAPVGATLDVFRQAAFARARRTGERAEVGTAYSMDGLELMAHVAAGGAPADLGYVDADLPAGLRHRLADGADRSAADLAPRSPEASAPSTDGTSAASRVREASPPGRRRASPGFFKVIVRVDAAALQRGHAEPGETCDIAGVGPVSVDAVRELLPDAFVGVVLTKGRDVVTVAHPGRRPDAYQQTALEWRSDRCCTRGCHNRARLQADHDEPWADCHRTWLPDLNRTCDQCHARKTHQGWAWIGELDVHGTREQVPPTDPRHPAAATRGSARASRRRRRGGPSPPPRR